MRGRGTPPRTPIERARRHGVTDPSPSIVPSGGSAPIAASTARIEAGARPSPRPRPTASIRRERVARTRPRLRHAPDLALEPSTPSLHPKTSNPPTPTACPGGRSGGLGAGNTRWYERSSRQARILENGAQRIGLRRNGWRSRIRAVGTPRLRSLPPSGLREVVGRSRRPVGIRGSPSSLRATRFAPREWPLRSATSPVHSRQSRRGFG